MTDEIVDDENTTIECEHCHKVIDCEDDSSTLYGDVYCCDCFNELFGTCDKCGDITNLDNITFIENVFYCTPCRDTFFYMCDECSDYVKKDAAIFIDSNGVHVCHKCYDNNYFQCENCGETISNIHYGRDGFCNGCCRDGEDNRDEATGGLHDHDYSPSLIFRDIGAQRPYPKVSRYYGIELEIECKDNSIPVIEDDYFYLKRDGSLTNGFEVVSHPSTWQWLQQHKHLWERILNLRTSGYRSHNTTTCGMHVHISRTAFSTWMLYKWLRFFVDNGPFIMHLSQRRPEQLNWCAFDDRGEIIYKAKCGRGPNKCRYEAINLENTHTVEIRIFRGTLNPIKFWTNLEFLEALFAWLEPFAIKDLNLMTVDNFLTYIHKNEKLYPNLFSWLSNHLFKGVANVFNDSEA